MSSGFISEKDAEERRRVRQENWEKNRNEDDPLEAPEELPPDHRSLYDRLQEQRQKKQDEYDEAHKFKNMVRGLEDDEVDFLELVDRSKLQEEKRVRTEESSAMAEYRKKVSAMQKNCAEEEMRAEMRAGEKKSTGGVGKKSHLSLLAGAIKRKHSDDDKTGDDMKAPKVSNTGAVIVSGAGRKRNGNKKGKNSSFQCIAVLPGLGVYTDSSDSETNSDVDDPHPPPLQQPRDITGRILKAPAQCSQSS